MAISSVLNPQNIIGNRQGTAEQFQNFITGGNSSLGSSVVNSTSLNKIVPFERGGVRPVTPDFNSIVSRISTKTDNVLDTNIKNQDNKVQGVVTNIQKVFQTTVQNFTKGTQENIKNQENKVQGVVNNIQNVFQTTLQNFTKGYQDKIKSIEDSKTSGILEKFFGLYNNVTGFIQFFGDRKNLNKISASLKGLRGLFEDSFETAKLIRKTINKIVKQLSSLPVASPSGGGGFNLDIRVPGSPLKNAAGKMLGGGRGKMLALGAGALGTGMLAGGAINALTGSEDIQPAAVQQSIPENLADSLSSIVDRFVNAIDELIKGASQKPKTTPSTSGGGGGGGSPAPSPSPSSPGFTGSAPVADVSKDTEFISEVQKLAKETGAKPSELMALYQAESGIRTTAKNKSGATGIFQLMFDPNNPNDKRYGKTREEFSAMSRADQVRAHKKYLEEVGFFKGGYKGLANLKVANIAPAFLGKGLDEPIYRKGTSAYSGNAPLDQPPFGNGDGAITAREYNNFVMIRGNPKAFEKYDTMVAPNASDSRVAPAPTQTKANAATISQPVTPKVTPISIPPQVSSAGGAPQGGGGGGGVSAPPPPSGGSPSVPFLPAGNVDNFLVLYSKMVYNIVDG
jgi:hypothetical protein